MALIELKDVSKYYNDGATSSKGIENINLSFDRGEFVAITGESGSGKTTFLNLITLMDSYDEGDIIFNGKSTVDFTNEDMIAFRNDYVSLVFQDYNIVQSVSVLDNVILALLNRNMPYKEAKKEAIEALTKCGLKDKLKTKACKLSGGEKQRVVIARAIALNSPVLAFDEPTGNLDSKTSKEIIKLIDEIKKDHLILYVTHDYKSIENIASRHIVLKDGNVVEDTIIKNNEIIDEPLKEKKNKTSLFAVLFSGIKLIFSMPKNFVLLLSSLLLFSVIGYVSAIGFASSDFLVNNQISMSNTSTRVFKSLPDSSLVVSLSKDEFIDKLPNNYFIDEGGYLSSLKIQFWDYVGYVDIGFYLPEDIKMQQEVTGDSGYYILYNNKNLNSYTLTKFKEMFFPMVGDTVNDLRISGIINDSETSIINECSNLIKNSTLLGIGDTNSINSAFSIILTRDLSTKLSENILQNIENSYIDPATYGMFEFYSLFTNYDLNDLLDIKLNGQKVNFTYNFKSDSKVFSSIYISEFYFDELDKIKVTVLNKTMSLKEFYNLFILEDDSTSINDINSKVFLSYEEIVSLGYQDNIGIYFPFQGEDLKLLLLNKIVGFSVIYFPNYNSAKAMKDIIGDKAHLGNETISRTKDLENYVSLITVLLPIIFLIILFAIIFIFASWVTSMLLRNVLNKYSADFAVLSTLGYRKGSIYLVRLILITIPTAISYVIVSTVLTLGIYAYLFSYNQELITTYMNLFLPSIVIFFFILIALGILISYFIDRKTRKMKTINLLKEAGGSLK